MIELETIGPVRKFRMARTLFGRGLYFTTAYWVDGLMIDTGCAYTAVELTAALGDCQVKRVVNTHSHEDHIGGNYALQQQWDAELFAHKLALPVLADPKGNQQLELYRRVMWGYPEPSAARPLGESVETANYRFQVIETPGHSPDHVCLYEPDHGWLFSGDLYIGGRDRALRREYKIWQIIESLKKISQLEIEILFPGSAGVRENPAGEMAAKITYLEQTGHRALALHKEGLTVAAIRRRLFGRELPIAYLTNGHFSGDHLVRSFLSEAG